MQRVVDTPRHSRHWPTNEDWSALSRSVTGQKLSWREAAPRQIGDGHAKITCMVT